MCFSSGSSGPKVTNDAPAQVETNPVQPVRPLETSTDTSVTTPTVARSKSGATGLVIPT